jgi:WD40 repeat protein
MKVLASAETDGAFQALHVLHGHADGIHALAVSADGRFLFSGSADRTILMWDCITGEASVAWQLRCVAFLYVLGIVPTLDWHSGCGSCTRYNRATLMRSSPWPRRQMAASSSRRPQMERSFSGILRTDRSAGRV